MTLLAPTLEAFFTQHLAGQRQASPRTIGSYRDTWRLFLACTLDKTGTAPAATDIAALDAGLVSGFLAHLEQDRGNTAGPATRGWPRSGRSSSSPPCATPSTPAPSPGSSRSPRRNTAGDPSPTSPRPRPQR
jgi:hypothetical protein